MRSLNAPVIAMYLKHREEGPAELDQLVLKDHLKD